MSQGSIFSSIDPNTTSGTQLATILNDFKDAVVAGFCTNGGTRPANLASGGYWIDQQNDPIWDYKLYDGTDDITIFTVNTTTNAVSIGTTGDSLDILKSSDDSLGAILELIKQRATGSGQTLDGDTLGSVDFTGTTNDPVQEVQARIQVTSTDDVTTAAHGSNMTISTTPDGGATLTERMRIQNDGKVGIGATTADNRLHVKGTSTTGNIENELEEDSAVGPTLDMNKKRIASSGQTQSADEIGNIDFTGTDQNGDDRVMAKIQVKATETTQSTQHGSEISLSTVENGGTTLTEQVKVDSAGNVVAAGDLDINGTGTSNFAGNVTVEGDLTINGTTTNVNTTNLDVTDVNITINNGGNQATADDAAGITVEMSDATDASILYDKDVPTRFKVGDVGSEVEVADISSSQTFTNKIRTGGEVRTPTRLDVKQNTFSALETYALTASNGQICFATDLKKYFGVQDTVLVSLGGGGGGLDTFDTEDFESFSGVNATGQNALFLGAGAIDGAVTTTAISPLSGSTSLLYTASTSSTNDYFEIKTIDIDPKQQGQNCKIRFVADTTGFANAIDLVIYDKTGSTPIETFTGLLPASTGLSFYEAEYLVPDTSTQISFGLHMTAGATNTETFKVDDFENTTDPFTIASLSESTDWVDGGVIGLTAETANPTKGTTATDKVWWRREGPDMLVRMEFEKTGAGGSAVGTGDYMFDIPDSKSIDTSKFAAILGSADNLRGPVVGSATARTTSTENAANAAVGVVVIKDATRVKIAVEGGTVLQHSYVGSDFINIAGASYYYLEFRVPIVGWSASVDHVVTPAKSNLTDWIPFTPTTNDLGTITAAEGHYKRVGDMMKVRANFVVGTPSGGVAGFDVPLGLTMDSSKLDSASGKDILGLSIRSNATNSYFSSGFGSVLSHDASDYTKVRFSNAASASTTLGLATGSAYAVSGDGIHVEFEIPILEWDQGSTTFLAAIPNSKLIQGAGNGGTSLTANVTDIDFTETLDELGEWSGTTLTPNSTGMYDIAGMVNFTASNTLNIGLYEDGVNIKTLVRLTSELRAPFNTVERLEAGKSYSLRSNVGATLSNTTLDHHINIVKRPF